MKNLIIRNAQYSDLDSLFKMRNLFATSFEIDYSNFSKAYENLIKNEEAFLVLIELYTLPIGYIVGFDHYTLFANGRVSWIEEIYITEEHRRKGYASKLVSEFENWGKSRNSRLIAMATRRANKFYLALGYEESALYFRKII
jgi:GNAT superfamily N-acetyltransferase